MRFISEIRTNISKSQKLPKSYYSLVQLFEGHLVPYIGKISAREKLYKSLDSTDAKIFVLLDRLRLLDCILRRMEHASTQKGVCRPVNSEYRNWTLLLFPDC